MKSSIKFFFVWLCNYVLFVAMTQGICNFSKYWQPFIYSVKNAIKYQYYNTAIELIISLFTLLFLTLIGFFIANLPFYLLKMERANRAFFFFLLFLICALTVTFLSYYTWLFLDNKTFDFNLYACKNYLKYIPYLK